MSSEAAPSTCITEDTSTKDKIRLILHNHKFHMQKMLSTEEERWACHHRNCKSFFRTFGESPRTLIREHSDFIHKHEPAYDRKLQSQLLSVSAKRKAVDQPCEDLQMIHVSVEKEHENLQLKKIFNIKRAMLGIAGSLVLRGPVFQVRVFNELVLYNHKFRLKTFRILNKTTRKKCILEELPNSSETEDMRKIR